MTSTNKVFRSQVNGGSKVKLMMFTRESDKQMQQLKRYLDKHGISWRPTENWSIIFQGNHPDGIT